MLVYITLITVFLISTLAFYLKNKEGVVSSVVDGVITTFLFWCLAIVGAFVYYAYNGGPL